MKPLKIQLVKNRNKTEEETLIIPFNKGISLITDITIPYLTLVLKDAFTGKEFDTIITKNNVKIDIPNNIGVFYFKYGVLDKDVEITVMLQ